MNPTNEAISSALKSLTIRAGLRLPRESEHLMTFLREDLIRFRFDDDDLTGAVAAYCDGSLYYKPPNQTVSVRAILDMVRAYRRVTAQAAQPVRPPDDRPAVETEANRQYMEAVLNEDLQTIRDTGAVHPDLQVRWGWVVAKRFGLDHRPYLDRAILQARKEEIERRGTAIANVKDVWAHQLDQLDRERRGKVEALATRMVTAEWLKARAGENRHVDFPKAATHA